MKILLIHPNRYAQRYVSVGIAMISSVLKNSGHEVMFFDTSRFREYKQNTTIDTLNRQTKKMEEVLQFIPAELPSIEKSKEFVDDALHSRIHAFKPDLIGLTATSSDFPYVIDIIEKIKTYHIPTIIGGSHSTVAPLDTISIDGVDMVCVGEGEEAILELVNSIESGRPRTDIQNIYFKERNKIIQNSIRPYTNLDTLPFLDLNIFDKYHHVGAYQGKLAIYGRFETGRGCPFKCTYCINDTLHNLQNKEKSHVRYKSPARIIAELKFGMQKIGYDIIRFVDETFTATPFERLSEFVELYRKEINKPMIISTRPERVNYKVMNILRDAHENIQVSMGIETGNEYIRKKVCNRNMSNKVIVKAFHICKELGFHTASFNMIGLPGETRKDFFQTIMINREAMVDTPMLSYFYPFPGTKLRDYCIEQNYINEEIHEVDYAVSSILKMPQFPINELEGLKRTFVLYVKMDESFYSEIAKAEHDDLIFSKLTKIYNEKHFSEIMHGNN